MIRSIMDKALFGLSKEDVLAAGEIYLHDRKTMYVCQENEGVFHFTVKGRIGWFVRSRTRFWESMHRDPRAFVKLSARNAVSVLESWEGEASVSGEICALRCRDITLGLHTAIVFAEEKYRGYYRESSGVSCMAHPMEVMSIITSQGGNIEAAIAAVLHVVPEIYENGLTEIDKKFGSYVALLVVGLNAGLPALEEALDETASRDLKRLIMADAISNLRHLVSSHKSHGEKIWASGSTNKEFAENHYGDLLEAFDDMQFDPDLKSDYWEMNSLYKHLFVDYYVTVEDGCINAIYQIFPEAAYVLEMDSPEWKEADAQPPDAVCVSKDIAEALEETWDESRQFFAQ